MFGSQTAYELGLGVGTKDPLIPHHMRNRMTPNLTWILIEFFVMKQANEQKPKTDLAIFTHSLASWQILINFIKIWYRSNVRKTKNSK